MHFSKTTLWAGATAAVFSLLILFQVLGAQQENLRGFIPPAGKYDVKILRDNYGVPHIFGKTDADAAYGLAWAHCEDDWKTMQEVGLVVHGKLASLTGNFEDVLFDFMLHFFRVREFVDEKYETDISPDVRAVLEAYAEGVTHFAALHRDKMPHVPLPVTGKDVVAGATLKAPFFYELHRHFLEVYQATEQPRPVSERKSDVKNAMLPLENPYTKGLPIGSNSFAVGPERSADGWTRLWVNSHQPWDGQVAWYEAHVNSEEGWNMIGGTFPGGPMIFSGHDEAKAWCHTVNRPDLADVYVLEINPKNKNQYKFDGEWRDFESRTANINLKLLGPLSWTVKMPLLWSVHGPALRTDHGVYAFRFVGYGEVRHMEQWFRMNKAKTFDEFQAAMAMNDLTSFNMVYADREGNLFYTYNGKFPLRDPAYNWKQYLPGNTSDALWTEFRPWLDVPKVINPPSAFIQSCNNTPFQTTVGEGNPKPEDFCPTMGIETSMNNRARRALQLWGADESITREEFIEYKWDKKYAEGSQPTEYIRKLLESDVPNEPLLQEALALLKNWVPNTEADNPGTALAVLASRPRMLFQSSFPQESIGEVEQLRHAAEFMMKHHGRLNVPWGEIMRLRRGDLDLPLGGGSETIRVITGELENDGTFTANYGDGLVMLVEWDPQGNVHGEAVHNYGGAITDPRSPSYASQSELFANEQLRPTLLHEEDIRANLAKEYKPGNGKLWHELP